MCFITFYKYLIDVWNMFTIVMFDKYNILWQIEYTKLEFYLLRVIIYDISKYLLNF